MDTFPGKQAAYCHLEREKFSLTLLVGPAPPVPWYESFRKVTDLMGTYKLSFGHLDLAGDGKTQSNKTQS